MKRRSRNLSIFNMSALDVLATAMGTFILLVVMLMPYYRQSFDANAEIEDVRAAAEEREAETRTLDAAAAATAEQAATLRAEVATLAALAAAAQAEANTLRADATANTEAGEATTAQAAEVAAIVERRIIRELDIVFVVDTTASMAPALRDLSLSLAGIVRVLERLVPSLRVGFVAYRDHDVPGWLTLQLPLTPTASDLHTVLDFADALGPPSRGGRTVAEALYEGLYEASRMPFRPTAKQTLIVVGDARAHDRRQQATLRLARDFALAGPRRTVSALFVPTLGYYRYGRGDREFFQALGHAGAGEFTDHTGRMTESVLLSVLAG